VSSEIDPQTQLIFDNVTKAMQWSTNNIFNKYARTTGHLHTKKKKKNLDIAFIPFTKMNSKWIIDLNAQQKKPIKFLEDNIGENLDGIVYSSDFLYNTKGIIHERNN